MNGFQATAERLGELNDTIKGQSAKNVFAIAHKCLGSSRTLGMTAIVPPKEDSRKSRCF
jgi:HPt (histidine-containing phosphotransfer) domain-containing protein